MRTLTVNQMIDIQDRINELTVPEWKSQLTDADFNISIMDEVAELLGSGRNWKWWKHGSNPHEFNELIEITDIVLFYISKISLNGINSELMIGDPTDCVSLYPSVHLSNGDFNRNVLNDLIIPLYDTVTSVSSINGLLFGFSISCELISSLYIAKTTLHEIRQSTGYKDGTYKKVVDGVEDNHRMEHIIDKFISDDEMSLDDVKLLVETEFFVKNDV